MANRISRMTLEIDPIHEKGPRAELTRVAGRECDACARRFLKGDEVLKLYQCHHLICSDACGLFLEKRCVVRHCNQRVQDQEVGQVQGEYRGAAWIVFGDAEIQKEGKTLPALSPEKRKKFYQALRRVVTEVAHLSVNEFFDYVEAHPERSLFDLLELMRNPQMKVGRSAELADEVETELQVRKECAGFLRAMGKCCSIVLPCLLGWAWTRHL